MLKLESKLAKVVIVHTGPELVIARAHLRADCHNTGHALAQRAHNAADLAPAPAWSPTGQLAASFCSPRQEARSGSPRSTRPAAGLVHSDPSVEAIAKTRDEPPLPGGLDRQLSWAMPQLLSAAAEWLLLGGVTRLVDYHAEDVDPPGYLAQLKCTGFRVLVRNERGFRRSI